MKKTDAQIIREHYRLARLPSAKEVADELANLRRRVAGPGLDDLDGWLYAKLDLGMRDSK